VGLFGFGKAKEEPKFRFTFDKCVGLIGGKIEYFYGLKKVEKLTKANPEYPIVIPKDYKGCSVLAILSQALSGYDYVADNGTIMMINANQGNPYDRPISFRFGGRSWQGAIFTHDKTHPMFQPLSFEPSDIAYGMVATYSCSEEIYGDGDYNKWLHRQIEGNGKETQRVRNGLCDFSVFDGEEPDWENEIRFLVRKVNRGEPLAFKICRERSSAIYDKYGQMLEE